jgi:predicted GTPase
MSATIEFDDFPDIKADITATSVKIVNFLIVGLTGSGKSSIIKSCCSDNHRTIATEMSVQSVTKNINYYEGNQITNPKDALDK